MFVIDLVLGEDVVSEDILFTLAFADLVSPIGA